MSKENCQTLLKEKQLRQETFFGFIKKAKLPFFFTWLLNVAYVVIMIFLLYKVANLNFGDAIIGPILITIGFLSIKSFVYWTAYYPYSAGGRAKKELFGQTIETFESVGIYIKGFDLFDQKIYFPPVLNRTIYDFDKADMILTTQSMVLMGKNNYFGGVSYSYPVEIVFGKFGLTSMPKARLINWEQNGNRIEIQIEDYHYKKPIKIDIKDRIEEIKKWLTSNYQEYQNVSVIT